MTRRGIILYGPPASGKDTITAALHELDPRYVLFPRLKAGPGRTTGYRMTTDDELDRLHAAGQIIYENRRYGARYAIDLPELTARLSQHIPVVHLGQVAAIKVVMQAAATAQWLVAQLRCPRDVALLRIEERRTSDAAARIKAWAETEPLSEASLSVDTSQTTAVASARMIAGAW